MTKIITVIPIYEKNTLCPVTVLVDNQVSDRCPWATCLKIPSYEKTKDMTPPQGTLSEALQENCDGLKVLLVDERSLIGATTLGWMEFMCRYGVNGGNNSDQSWGGVPVVVFVGDDVQLPPVLDYPVYNNKGTFPAALHGSLVWQAFTTVVNLKTMVRQREEEHQLRDVLIALRESKVTADQAKWLQNFLHHNLKSKYGDKLLQRMNSNGLFVFPTHEGEWAHNKKSFLRPTKKIPSQKLIHQIKGPTPDNQIVPEQVAYHILLTFVLEPK